MKIGSVGAILMTFVALTSCERGYSYTTSELDMYSPWLEPFLEPWVRYQGDFCHGSSKHTSSNALGLRVASSVSLSHETAVLVQGALGSTDGKSGYPALGFSINKQLSNDIGAYPSSCLASSITIDGSVASKSRVRQLLFQEWGVWNGAVGFSIGRHLQIVNENRFYQLFAHFKLQKTSSHITSIISTLSFCRSFSQKSAIYIDFSDSRGHGSLRGSLGRKSYSLQPNYNEGGVKFEKKWASFGVLSLSLSYRAYRQTSLKIASCKITYTKPIEI